MPSTQSTTVEIPLSKGKLMLMFLGACVFVALGIWILMNGITSLKTMIVAYIGTPFFGLCAILCGIKLFDKKPGLMLTQHSLIDNSSGIALGEIPWREITEIKSTQSYGQRLILVYVKHPEDYLNRPMNAFKRKAFKLNYKLYKTPLLISPNTLKIRTEELLKLLHEHVKN